MVVAVSCQTMLDTSHWETLNGDGAYLASNFDKRYRNMMKTRTITFGIRHNHTVYIKPKIGLL